jgi:hypothetical protein
MLEKSGEPTFGVVEIDLSSGRETLLASSRREPAVTPLESERLGVFYRIGLIGETAFNVRGRSVASRHAFDLATREWRPLTEEDRKALAGDGARNQRTMLIEAGGRTWHLYMATRKNHLRVHTGRENDFLDIPLSFDYGSYETEYQAYRGAVKKAQRHRARDSKPIVATPHGLMVWVSDGFYFWLPMDKVKAAIADTHARRRSGAAASSSP